MKVFLVCFCWVWFGFFECMWFGFFFWGGKLFGGVFLCVGGLFVSFVLLPVLPVHLLFAEGLKQ